MKIRPALVQGLSAPLTSLLCLPASRSCLAALQDRALSHCKHSKQRDSSSRLPGQYFHSMAAFPSGECSCGLAPEVQLEECSNEHSVMKLPRSIALILKAFLWRWAVVDIAGVLLSIHKPAAQDDMEQVLPFHRSIFTHRVPIAQAETAQGSTTKWEDHIRTTVLKVILCDPWYNLVGQNSLYFA